MLKKILAAVTTALLAAGLSVIAVAAPAAATHPTVTGTYACNPTTGLFDITWRVTGDTQYPNETATIKTQTQATTPTLVGLTVKGAGYVEAVQSGVSKGTYSQRVEVQWTNHSQGDLVGRTGSVTIPNGASCYIVQDDTVDCTAATVYLGAALANGNYINMTIRQNGVEKQMSGTVDFAANYGQTSESGLVIRVNKLDGTQAFLPITNAQKNSGILRFEYAGFITGPFTVTWVQFDGHNWHFGADGEVLNCGTVEDASAEVTFSTPTCEAGQGVTLGTIANATWGELVIDEDGNYSVTATANDGHLFPGGQTTKTFQGTLLGPDTSLCEPDLECLPRSSVSYTYVPATNSGVVTVVNPDPSKYSNELCQGFWVTATSWKYTTTSKWPQIRDVVQKLPKITSVGTYPYVAAVECGQGDIYASFIAQPDPTEWLYGPSNPFPETFLHNMGFTGPSPTWTQNEPGCNQIPVEPPVPHAITECGTYGSITIPADTEYVTYTLTGNGRTGTNTVTATAVTPYVLSGYPVGGWTFDLGEYTDCEITLSVTYVRDCAVDPTNTWRVYNPGEETVVVTYGSGQTHQATPGYSVFETPRADETITIAWGETGSGLAPGTASATSENDYTGDDEPCYTEPDVSHVVGVCVYDAEANPADRSLSITYDNSASNVAVTFSLVGFGGAYDRTVEPGDTYTFSAPNVTPAGGTYTVTAAGEEFTITVPECQTYDKPEPKTRDEVVPSYDCTTAVVTLTTTTYTTDWVFNPSTLTWEEGEEVAGTPVVTTRAMTPEEIAQEVCLVVASDPEASTCEATDQTEFTSWIRVELNENIEYRIDGELVTSEYTEVTPGEHTVVATALNGYTLQGAQPEPDDWTDTTHTWTFTAVDSATECGPTLEGSFATGVCEANAPWIDWSVAMSDPYNRATSHHAYLVITDGTNTETLDLGELVYNDATGKWELSDKTLWPGASVDAEGNATGWPGWEQLEDGTWQETTANFAWTRDTSQATFVVNPELVVDLSYPDATPECSDPDDNPTLAQVLPEYSSTPLTCTAAGSYTIGAEFGDVSWTVNGVPTPAGTYTVKTPGTVTLEASPTDPEDSFDAAWVDEPIVLAFAYPGGNCASLLALTGAATSFGIVWAAALVALTGVGIVLLRRKTTAL